MKLLTTFIRLVCLTLTLSSTYQAQAGTIFWGSAFNDQLFDSNGVPLDESFSFEIGSFGSFVPTYQNVDLWGANWKVFDRAYDPDANGWKAEDQFFVGTVNYNTLGNSDSPDANPTDVFAQGETAYLSVLQLQGYCSVKRVGPANRFKQFAKFMAVCGSYRPRHILL